jgi:8-oxo-dGTP pyrophosphatase MutT (NUDIX family)
LYAIRRELQEELGVTLPKDAFEMIFIFLQEWLVDQNPFFLC